MFVELFPLIASAMAVLCYLAIEAEESSNKASIGRGRRLNQGKSGDPLALERSIKGRGIRATGRDRSARPAIGNAIFAST